MVADPAEASQSVTITVQGQVRGGTLAGSVLSNRARVTADQEDLDRSNNLALVATTVQPSCAVAPDVPTQLFPADGATVAVRNVTLDWDFTNCAVRYRVVVRRGSVSGPVVYRATTQQTHRTVAVGPGDYFWRVSACDVVACKRSPWRSFTR
jgi:hypothetical protein